MVAPGRQDTEVSYVAGPNDQPHSHVVSISTDKTVEVRAFPVMEEVESFLDIIKGGDLTEEIEVVLFGSELEPLVKPLGLYTEDIGTGQQVAIRRYHFDGEGIMVIQIFRYQGGTKDRQGLRFGRTRVIKENIESDLYALLKTLHSTKRKSIDEARAHFADRCDTVISNTL